MPRRLGTARRLLRGVCALVVLAALVAAVPLALVAFVGWPLPRAVPSWKEVVGALNGASISDAVLINSLASATWVLWALLTACFVAEARAWVHGREARDLRFAGLVQPIMRELVVSAALVIGSLRPAGLVAPTMLAVSDTRVVLPESPPAAVTGNAPTADAAPTQPTCVVLPRDSLWKLADDHLGDGLRWREIWELNRGRTFADGRRFVDPSLINPGWVLELPSDAVGLLRATVPPTPTEPPRLPPRPKIEPSTTTTTTTTTAPAAAPVVSATTATPTPTAPTTTNGHQPTPVPSPADDPDYGTKPLLAGSALLAAGLIASLARLRRRQMRYRAPGHLPQLPGPESARAEVHLRRAAAGAPFNRLDLALRVLAHCVGQRESGPCPAIAAVSVGPEAIEILLTDVIDAPSGPFTVEARGRAWTLPVSVPDDELQPIADTQAGPAPTLVTVGTIDERSVLVDLEASACTLLGGDPADAAALLWTLAFDLVTSNRADDLNVVVVGDPPAGLHTVGRARVVSRIDDVIDELEVEAGLLSASLRAQRRSTTFEARVSDPGDVLTPTVVLVEKPEAGIDRLLKAAHDHAGLAVVVAGDAVGQFDRELCVEGDTLLVKPVGLRLTPAALPAEILHAAGDLLRVAADTSPGEVLDLSTAPTTPTEALAIGPDRLPLAFDAHGQPIVPPGHVMVRVLGPVEIVGGRQPIDRRRSVELVTYLALHPEGVDDGRLRTALWPEGAPTQAAFNETVSRARRMLGLDPHGHHHVRHVDNRRYRLGPYVFTDAALLEQSVGGHGWEDVLRLVRGLPFDGTSTGYEWAYEEGQAHRLLVLIEEAGTGSTSGGAEHRLPHDRAEFSPSSHF